MPSPVSGTPIFHFSGKIGNDSLNYQAGVDHLYMYSSFYKDAQNLISLQSYFAPDNCSNCEPYLSFEVKDFDVSISNGLAGTALDIFSMGNIFNSYSLDSIVSTTQVEVFTFAAENNKVGTTYAWDFGDGGTSTLASPSYIFSTGGVKNVRLVTQYGGTIDTLSIPINTDINSTCRVQFSSFIDTLSGNSVIVNATPSGFLYNWNFGNGSMGTGQIDSTFYPSPGKYTITLNATLPSCNAVFARKVYFGFLNNTLSNFSYTTNTNNITTFLPRLNTSAFIITYKKNGVVYKSYKNIQGINQSANPVIQITNVQTYSVNANGNKTLVVNGNANTFLYNQSNSSDSIRLQSSDIKIAFAYPE
ncbi:MAG: hypothetical protein IPI46_02100 [Bacteroidetes bacterium]|nr:hypothetical protein [Bacteroidota bacterium]